MAVITCKYANEEVLVYTRELAENLKNPNIRIWEVDHDQNNACD